MAAKGGDGAGYRPVARRPDYQDPRAHRCPRSPWRPAADARQRQRRDHRSDGLGRSAWADPASGRRQGYDADWLRADLRKSGITPVIPGKRGRKRKIRHDRPRYRERWRIEATFNRLKDFRRIATRYDKLARNYASALALAAVIAFWC